ncbi:hypothetical protein B0O99DRAFT_692867 [Bisporella sp. PMI_857]|nr:hypothetical protein B0O99DRAFT_692867 [Bisporella sp. PMI_857]
MDTRKWIAKILPESKAVINLQDVDYRALLSSAARKGQVAALQLLLDTDNVNIDWPDANGGCS